jgi:dTDP-4-amino-4,6-dideoxygalactose transaminase
MYGNPADMDRIGAIASRRGLAVVEDAALALGATYRGTGVGAIGTAGCFSFSPFKILGAFGQGGMAVTNDAALAARVRLYSDHGLEPESLDAIRRGVAGARFICLVEGYNGHLDELQAAILRVKLRQLPRWQQQRVAHARLYREMLADLEPDHVILPVATPHAQAVYRVFVIRTTARDALLDHLAAAGIYAGVHDIPPLHLQPAYRHLGLGPGSFPATERVADALLCLSTAPELSSAEIEEVAHSVRAFFARAPGRVAGR